MIKYPTQHSSLYEPTRFIQDYNVISLMLQTLTKALAISEGLLSNVRQSINTHAKKSSVITYLTEEKAV